MKWPELERQLLEKNNGDLTITVDAARKALGVGRDLFLKNVRDCPRVPNSKRLYVHDVAVAWCGGIPR